MKTWIVLLAVLLVEMGSAAAQEIKPSSPEYHYLDSVCRWAIEKFGEKGFIESCKGVNPKITLKKAYEELKSYLHKKIKEQDDFYTFRGFSDINERQVRIIKILKRKPAFFFTVKELTTRFEISPKTARSDLQRLVERGILEEVPVNKRKTGYVKSSRFDTILQELTSH